jgi:hypothetical protein
MSEYDEEPDLAPEEHGSEQDAADERAPVVGGEAADDAAVTGDGSEGTSTGVAVVDDVLASVQALDGRPVEEHVAVFEQAHERLRRALDPGHG